MRIIGVKEPTIISIWYCCSCVLFLLIVEHSVEAQFEKAESFKDFNDDLAISDKEKLVLNKFKERVFPILPHKYMREDIYLIRWLRSRNFDLESAEEFLKKNLKWRKEFKMDGIHDEDWSDVTQDFTLYIDTIDKKGQPAVIMNLAQWSIRKSHVTGRNNRVLRYSMKALDLATKMVRDSQLDGKNITRFDYIFNLEGSNLIEHGCPRCLITIINNLSNYESYFPGMIDKLILINSPTAFRTFLAPLVKAAVNINTLGTVNLKIIGTNRNDWRRYLLKYFDEAQLAEDYGGTRVRD